MTVFQPPFRREMNNAGTISKNVHVNPLVAGNNILYNKGRYTVASSTCDVKETKAEGGRVDTVHYNPKFFSVKSENVHVNPNYLSSSSSSSDNYPVSNSIHVNPNFLNRPQPTAYSLPYSSCPADTSKYKYVRKEVTAPIELTTTIQPKLPEPKTMSKYKLVYSTAPLTKPVPSSSGVVIKSKYSIRTRPPITAPSATSSSVNPESKMRISCDFKRISRTKLVRKSVRTPKSRFKPRSRQSLKLNHKLVSSERGNFKTYGRTKLVRKSVLRAQINARKTIRKSLNCSVPLVDLQPLVKSKYKLIRTLSKKIVEPSSKRSLNTSKLKKRKSLIAKTAKLRKNNQRCLFYNRFGRCKGKDRGTCYKIHDPLYISVCKKLPFSDCSDTNCQLSHDVRPGKMPTCYHYLAGVCTRDVCPYLHIKVNPKAPICHSFLQGFCPDVFNCLKRHEYICAVFAETGSCPKGKSCAHPHKIPTVYSKLLAEDQTPLMAKKLPPTSRKLTVEPPAHEPVAATQEPICFTRYFSVPLSSDTCDIEDEEVK